MYGVISFSYKKLEIALREKIAVSQEELKDFYHLLQENFRQIQELIVLSTCNRFEIITFGEMQDFSPVLNLIADFKQVSLQDLKQGVEIFEEREAIRHIFKVASSLDSLVVGETQIIGQLKNAYKYAFENGFCKKELTRLVHFASQCSAKIRTQTQISKNPTSVASVAIAQFLKLCPKDKRGKAIVVGTGEIGILSVKHLLAHQFEVVLINRKLQNAQDLAKELGDTRVSVLPFEKLPEAINSYPYLFSATGAPHTIITQEMVEKVDFERYWFDLALPRDIEKIQDTSIKLFVIDDLVMIANQNLDKRKEELSHAQEIVEEFVEAFEIWRKNLEVEPLIKLLRSKAKECCLLELQRAIKKGFLPKEQEECVQKILHNAFNKFLHHPTIYIKTIKENPKSDLVLESVMQLFNLKTQESLPSLLENYKEELDNENE